MRLEIASSFIELSMGGGGHTRLSIMSTLECCLGGSKNGKNMASGH